MKKLITMAMLLGAVSANAANPLLESYKTPFQTPPFDKIKLEHYEPAFDKGLADARAEIDAIVNNPAAPTFENTIVAMERSGKLLEGVVTIFYNLNSSETSDEMEQIATRIQPKLSEFSNDISLNPKLFARIKAVYDKGFAGLDKDQKKLLENSYKGFTRSGALLGDADQKKYRELSSELSSLTLKFGQNVLAATNAFTITIPQSDAKRIEGLPSFVVEGMAQEAKESGEKGWKLTLQAPSMQPFLTYSKDRELKEKLWYAYNSRCVGGENDNTQIVKRIAELRLDMAKLLGYKSYADFVLEERMAENAANVQGLLTELLTASKSAAQRDYDTIEAFAKEDKEFGGDALKPWDFGYYSEQYKNKKYAFNEEQLKPYFQLENAQKGIFILAEKLFGLKFVENKQIPVYHPDVKTFEVYDDKGKFMSVLYMDFFPRKSKRGGAWMSDLRSQSVDKDGKEVRPLITMNCNFTKPTETTPSLLTFREVETMLHEFGHCLHGILAEGRYGSLTGTNVYRDFVELPSQIMENWASEKDWLDLWAVHYKTGEKMPVELIEKVTASKNYLAGYLNIRQLSFGLNDMNWHSITAPVAGDVTAEAFEKEAIAATALTKPIDGVAFSPSFTHIFSGGYAAGYYSYKWAEVLEADAYSLFKQKGIFNREVAKGFRDNVLSQGGAEHPMELYVRFRGHKPDVKALINKLGLGEQNQTTL